MSLMHAALQVLQAGEAPSAPPPADRARRWALPPGVLAGLGVAVVLPAALAAAGLLGRHADAAPTAAVDVPAAAPPMVVTSAEPVLPPAPVPTVPAVAPVTTPIQAAQVAPPPASRPMPPAEPASEPPKVARAAPEAPATIGRTMEIQVSDAVASPAEPTADAAAIARAVATVDQALGAGDLAAADTALAELAALLPARSLTLLRRQAWRAHLGGDAVEAIRLYREIATRMPDDRTTTINLALLEAGEGDVEGASRRLEALRASVGESAELAAAMAQVGAHRP